MDFNGFAKIVVPIALICFSVAAGCGRTVPPSIVSQPLQNRNQSDQSAGNIQARLAEIEGKISIVELNVSNISRNNLKAYGQEVEPEKQFAGGKIEYSCPEGAYIYKIVIDPPSQKLVAIHCRPLDPVD